MSDEGTMADYYEDMEALAEYDNEIDRLERLEQIRDLDERTTKLIQQQMGIIKTEIIASRDKWWIERVEKTIHDCYSGSCKFRATCSDLKFSCQVLQSLKQLLDKEIANGL